MCNTDKSQPIAQKGRGCLEQISSLRLLGDYARYKKVKLYFSFIDVSKAYEWIPLAKLI